MADKLIKATAAKLLKLLPICPACNITTQGHLFALIATAIIGEDEKPRITELIFSREEARLGRTFVQGTEGHL